MPNLTYWCKQSASDCASLGGLRGCAGKQLFKIRVQKVYESTLYFTTTVYHLYSILFIGKISKYQSYKYSQCYTRLDAFDAFFGATWFIGRMTGDECRDGCDDGSNKDSNVRRCVAYEHSSQNPADVANCSLAWACDFTRPWSEGATYIRIGIRFF